MKTSYILIQLISILALGLISCSPDKASEQSEPEVKTKAEIQNTDDTIQKIIGSSAVRASANISLEIEQGSFTKGNILASVECKTNFLKEILTKDTVLKPATNIHVKDILPSKVFSPSAQDNPSVKCDMHLNINNEQDPLIIKLVGVKILGTKEFSNIEFDFIPTDNKVQLRETLIPISFKAPIQQGEVETLCEKNNSFSFINEVDHSLEDFIDESLFDEKNLIHCRLLFRSDETSETWITKTFRAQNQQAAIHIESTRHWPGTTKVSFHEASMVVYRVSNPTKIPAKIKIKVPKTRLEMSPVYKQGLTPNFWVNDRPHLNAEWKITNRSAPMDQDSKTGAITLEPGHSFEFHLVVDGEAQCTIGMITPNPQRPNCHTSYVHIGNEYLITDFPQIFINKFQNEDSDQWSDVSIYEKQKKFNNRYMGHWAPNHNVSKTCHNWQTFQQPSTDFSSLSPNFNQYIYCR